MNKRDIIDCWKSESCRLDRAAAGLPAGPDNPAGPSPLRQHEFDVSGGSSPSTILIGSYWLSCTISCAQTMWDGTCDFFSYGCCPNYESY
jgi:hypothetical protein